MEDEQEELPEGQDTFPREYVEKLRDEAAKYRTRSAGYEEAFKGLTENEKAFLLEAASHIGADDVSGAYKLREVAQVILGDSFYEGLDMPAGQEENKPAGDEAPATDIDAIVERAVAAALEKQAELFDERLSAADAKRTEEQEIADLFKEIEGYGFKQGTPEFQAVLSLAQVEAAHDRDVDFEALAGKVKVLYDIQPEGETGEAEGDEKPAGQHPPTVDLGSHGSPSGTNEGNFLDRAKEAAGETGKVDYMKAAADAAQAFFDEQV